MHPLLTHTHSPAPAQSAAQDPSLSQTHPTKQERKNDGGVTFANVFEDAADASKTLEPAEPDTTLQTANIAEEAVEVPAEGLGEGEETPPGVLPDLKKTRLEKAQISGSGYSEHSKAPTGGTPANTSALTREFPASPTQPANVVEGSAALPSAKPVALVSTSVQPQAASQPTAGSEIQKITSGLAQAEPTDIVDDLPKPSYQAADLARSDKSAATPLVSKSPAAIGQPVTQPDPNASAAKTMGARSDQELIPVSTQNNPVAATTVKDQATSAAHLIAVPQPSGDPGNRTAFANRTSSEAAVAVTQRISRPTSTPQPQWNVVQPPTISTQFEAHRLVSSGEADPLAAPRVETVGTTAPHQHTLPTRMDLPQHVARQIADALQHLPKRPVEIMLSPEELGRVRLGVSTSEGNIMVSVLAERPETTELMRRHISALETAFQELGYSNINFSFNGDQSAESDGTDTQKDGRQASLTAAQDLTTDATQLHLSSAPVTGVDIRL